MESYIYNYLPEVEANQASKLDEAVAKKGKTQAEAAKHSVIKRKTLPFTYAYLHIWSD